MRSVVSSRSWVIVSDVRMRMASGAFRYLTTSRGDPLAGLLVLVRLTSKPMVQSASTRMAVSLVDVTSGRAGGAAGRERTKTNARQ